MSHSVKKVCGGPWACCGNMAVKAWKRNNWHKYRRLTKLQLKKVFLNEDYESPGEFKKITDSWGPRDGSTIYWLSERDAELSADWALDAYKKALRK